MFEIPLRKLRNIRKISNLGGGIAQCSFFKKYNFGNSSRKTLKSRYQTFLVLSNVSEFVYFTSNILSEVVALVYSKQKIDQKQTLLGATAVLNF